ncbi:MAG: hypothetical protein U9O94_03335 [Nanoarchaeota archaeon]|nr:hypothetical protein [Nanoarchaeota archaeon]
MKTKELLKKLEGIQTIETVKDILGITMKKAIYYIFRLRKKGYVKTKKLSDNKRVYNISFENRLKGISYYDIINKHSPFKLSIPVIYKVYGKEPTIEETIIFALKTRSLRTVIASLPLFNKIEDWGYLYRLGKQNHLERQIGALYDMTRGIMKTRKMTKRFRNNALPKDNCKFRYVIQSLKSSDFRNIEKTWRVYLPFNKNDLEAYKK